MKKYLYKTTCQTCGTDLKARSNDEIKAEEKVLKKFKKHIHSDRHIDLQRTIDRRQSVTLKAETKCVYCNEKFVREYSGFSRGEIDDSPEKVKKIFTQLEKSVANEMYYHNTEDQDCIKLRARQKQLDILDL